MPRLFDCFQMSELFLHKRGRTGFVQKPKATWPTDEHTGRRGGVGVWVCVCVCVCRGKGKGWSGGVKSREWRGGSARGRADTRVRK